MQNCTDIRYRKVTNTAHASECSASDARKADDVCTRNGLF